MKFCILASGSKANCTIVSEGDTRLLIDCGIRFRAFSDRLAAVGVAPDSISAICLTHDHSDHMQGLDVFLRHHPGVPLYATEGSCASISRCLRDKQTWNIITPGSEFSIGCLRIHPFATPHDASESVGYLFRCPSGSTLGYATDLGYVPAMVQMRLAQCNALILESNHDRGMLRNSGRPWSLIERISGNTGHLSNEQSAELVDALLDTAPLRTLVLAHLSEECNTPEEALGTHRLVLRRHHCLDTVRLLAASQHEPTPILEV